MQIIIIIGQNNQKRAGNLEQSVSWGGWVVKVVGGIEQSGVEIGGLISGKINEKQKFWIKGSWPETINPRIVFLIKEEHTFFFLTRF